MLLQCPEQVESAVGAGGGLALLPVQADQERRAAELLRHPRGHNADHALVPFLIRQDDCLRRLPRRQHRDGLAVDFRFNFLPLTVQPAQV